MERKEEKSKNKRGEMAGTRTEFIKKRE